MKSFDLKRERRSAWKKHQHELKRAEVRKADHLRSLGIRVGAKQFKKKEDIWLEGLEQHRLRQAARAAIKAQVRADRAKKDAVEKGLQNDN